MDNIHSEYNLGVSEELLSGFCCAVSGGGGFVGVLCCAVSDGRELAGGVSSFIMVQFLTSLSWYAWEVGGRVSANTYTESTAISNPVLCCWRAEIERRNSVL